MAEIWKKSRRDRQSGGKETRTKKGEGMDEEMMSLMPFMLHKDITHHQRNSPVTEHKRANRKNIIYNPREGWGTEVGFSRWKDVEKGDCQKPYGRII